MSDRNSVARYVEGRLTFSMRWHPKQESVAQTVSKLMDVLQGAGCDVRALDASLVTKEVQDSEAEQQS